MTEMRWDASRSVRVQVRVTELPYPHFHLTKVFHPEVYACMLSMLPETQAVYRKLEQQSERFTVSLREIVNGTLLQGPWMVGDSAPFSTHTSANNHSAVPTVVGRRGRVLSFLSENVYCDSRCSLPAASACWFELLRSGADLCARQHLPAVHHKVEGGREGKK